MKVIFIYPEYSYPRKSPPIGLALLASIARNEGHEVSLLDMNIDEKTTENYFDKIMSDIPDVICISFMTNQYKSASTLIAKCKQKSPNSLIIVGGPHATSLPEETLSEIEGIDYLIIGEGEIALKEILGKIGSGSIIEKSNINGLYYRDKKNGKIVGNNRRNTILNLDELPMPAWDLLQMQKYSVMGTGGDPAKITYAILSSRGCPGNCIFCDSHNIFGRKYRGRSADNIFEEIKFLHEKFGAVQFDFVDDLINYDRDRLLKLCQLLKKSEIDIRWMANARVDKIDQELLFEMKKAGCVRVEFGVESGSQRVRKIMKKGISNKQIINSHRWAKKAGLVVGSFLMVGNLGETIDDVKETASLMRALTDDPSVAIACPYPGTELFDIAKERGLLRTTNWDQYGTAPTFMKKYMPIMVNETMNEQEIINAYYYLQSKFAIKKIKTRYGKHFYLNPKFIKEYILKAKQYGGINRKMAFAWKLFSNWKS